MSNNNKTLPFSKLSYLLSTDNLDNSVPPDEWSEEILCWHNYFRRGHGSPLLSWDKALAATAQKYADYIRINEITDINHSSQGTRFGVLGLIDNRCKTCYWSKVGKMMERCTEDMGLLRWCLTPNNRGNMRRRIIWRVIPYTEFRILQKTIKLINYTTALKRVTLRKKFLSYGVGRITRCGLFSSKHKIKNR